MQIEKPYQNLAMHLLASENALTAQLAEKNLLILGDDRKSVAIDRMVVTEVFDRSRNAIREMLIQILDQAALEEILELNPELAFTVTRLYQDRLMLIDALNTLLTAA